MLQTILKLLINTARTKSRTRTTLLGNTLQCLSNKEYMEAILFLAHLSVLICVFASRVRFKLTKVKSQLFPEYDTKLVLNWLPNLSQMACIKQTKMESEEPIKRKIGKVSSNSWDRERGTERVSLYFRPAVVLTHHCQELWPFVWCPSRCK